MPIRITTVLALVLAALLASCAPKTVRPTIDPSLAADEAERQREMVVREELAMLRRLDDVAVPIMLANAPVCDKTTHIAGFNVGNVHVIKDKEWRAAWRKAGGLGEHLTVLSVATGGPADRAGLREGDEIVAVNGVTAPFGIDAKERWAEAAKPLQEGKPLELKLRRADGEHVLPLFPEQACAYPAALSIDPDVNAYADGKRIVVLSGMMDFMRSDDDLALIVGHELAHNTMGHVQAKMGNKILMGLLGAVLQGLTGAPVAGSMADAGGLLYSQEFEMEADYVGLYYTARTGRDITNAADVWRRMAAKFPAAIGNAYTHPTTADRFVGIDAAVQEIRAKQAASQELKPNMKPEAAQAAQAAQDTKPTH